MRIRRITILLLILSLLLAPVSALAEKASIKLPAGMVFVKVGATGTLRGRLKNVSASELTFTSSDESVVSVSATGKLEAKRAGRAVIAVSGGGASARMKVVVEPASVTLTAGEKLSLPYGNAEKFTVKNKSVAVVSAKGVITAKRAGATAVVVKYKKMSVTIPIEVKAASGGDAEDPGFGDIGSATQVVLVEYKSGSSATLSVHEKSGGAWKTVLTTPAYVGKNGIGKTKEGDKKTPTGVYNLNTPFGIKADPGANMEYTKVTKYHYWCGDSSSKYYNQLCDSRVNGRNYTKSDEHLIDYKGVYNYCMFIDYNAAGVAHKGSCIFLHCTGSNKYTAGCIAIKESAMKQIIKWARPGCKIVIK